MAYEAGLRQRGSLTIWFSQEAIAAWRAAPRSTPGGQARYSDLAIEIALIRLRQVSRHSVHEGMTQPSADRLVVAAYWFRLVA